MTSRIALIIVSHSGGLAQGVCDVARQMAPDVPLWAAGGTDDGGIGTSFTKVREVLDQVDEHCEALILTDLGSAVMTAETVLEFLPEDRRGRFRLANAALVEGTVAAAVAAQGGATLSEVAAAAESAVQSTLQPAVQPTGQPEGQPTLGVIDEGTDHSKANGTQSGSWKLVNPMGLHARPAAAIAQAMAPLDAEVTINGVDAKSVMLLMTLALKEGEELTVSATGPEAKQAVELIRSEVTNGFGEL